MILQSFKQADITEMKVAIITIYNKPADYPNSVVARLFNLNQPTDLLIVKDSIEDARADILNTYGADAIYFGRQKEDEEHIVEFYLIV